ncbi:hypothetical protein [uncultured Ruegeria sp.]|uniref:hypothetical protein n=1 Tax=uncultured Ruegeria sp. TaxID=259304 RepID=UPI0026302C29|nr:hypothetical protein [uncultured Ruegeria sp.]
MLRKLLGSSLFKTASIEMAIEGLAKDDVRIGTAFREISHTDVMRYIDKRKFHVRKVIPRPQGDWVEFYALIENKIHVVRLDVARDGIGSILTSHYLDLSIELRNVFRDDLSKIMFGLSLPYTDASYEKWRDFDIQERLEEDMLLAGRLMRKFFEVNPLAFYPLLAACEDFHAPQEHLGLFDLLCHEGIPDERRARLQCYLAVESLMTNNHLPCFRTVNLQRVSEMVDEMSAEQTG